MLSCRYPALFTLVILVAFVPTRSIPADLPTNERMRAVVKQFVAETGGNVIGLGSWISNKKYADPLTGGKSDHDMRLLIPRGTTPEQAAKQWNEARKELISKIRQEFGKDADKVLKTVNLYPPTQLMQGVEDADDALQQFKRLKQVPALSYVDEVTDNTPASFAEGLYGEGADAFTQRYEKDAGRLFYKENGKVYVGMTDFTHLSEGEARFTIRGSVSTSRQWISHLDDALDAGDVKAAAKYLERLERDLSKARDLARCGVDREWSQAMKTIITELRNKPQADTLRRLTGTVRGLVTYAGRQTAVLGAMEGQSAATVSVLKEILTKPGSSTSSVLDDLAKVIDAPLEKIIGGLVAAIMTMQLSTVAGEEGFAEAIRQGVPMFADLPAGLFVTMADAILKDAESAGIELVAGRQDAWDLMAGIYNGRNIEVDERTGTWDVDRLVAQVHDINKIKSMVMARAYAAARSGLVSGADVDAKVTQRIYDRCYPVILQAWRAKREKLYAEFDKITTDLQMNPVALIATPSKSVWPKGAKSVKVALAAVSRNGVPEKPMQRMQQIAALITGLKAKVAMNYKFLPAGSLGDYPNQASLSFSAPGRYTANVTREIKVRAEGLDPNHQLAAPVNTDAMVEIEITKQPEEKPVAKPVKPITVAKPKPVALKPKVTSSGASTSTKPPAVPKPKRMWVLVDVTKQKVQNHIYTGFSWDEPTITENRVELMARDIHELTPWRTKNINDGKPFKCWATWTIPPSQLIPGQKFSITISGEYANFYMPAVMHFAWPGEQYDTSIPTIAPSGSQKVIPITMFNVGTYMAESGNWAKEDDKPGRKMGIGVWFEVLNTKFEYWYVYELR